MGLIIPVDEDIVLRQIQERDSKELARVVAANYEPLSYYFDWAKENYDDADAIKFAKSSLEGFDKRQQLQMCIVEDDKIVGEVGWLYWQQSKHENPFEHPIVSSVDLIYWLAENASGKGVMSKSVEKLVSYAFRDLGLNRVTIRTEPENKKSIAVAERLGFVYEGTMRDVARWQDRKVSLSIYAMLVKDWKY
ncbi:GNAT family N-acetyltransferase [Planctomycetota bacterium]|nr:GNAT family N-acetyltransferase [Planctomycetota bacterium]